LIASSSKSGNINLWSVETGEKAQTLEPSGKFTMCVAFVRYDRAYVSVLLLHRPLIPFFVCYARSHSLQSPNGKYVACGAVDGLVTVFEVRDGKRLHSIEGSSTQRRSINHSSSSSSLPRLVVF
jgi:WD repeat-containing protein 61